MRVIIIGGTAAGMSAAAKLRRIDKTAEVVVYEKRSYVSFGACGLPYYVGDFFDNTNQMLARKVEQTRESGIELYTEQEVIAVDVEAKTVTVRNLKTNEERMDSFDQLMIASGASPIVPPFENGAVQNVFTLHSMEDGIALKEAMKKPSIKRVGIIGAGFIGLEVVEAAKQYGKEVAVFQKTERILNTPFDQEVTDLLEEELESHGVSLYRNAEVTGFTGEEQVEGIVCNGEVIPVDLVVVAVGVRPNTSFLKESPIAMLPNGAVIVDVHGKTNIEGVYAAGDCATVPHKLNPNPVYIPLATSANKLGRIVGENLGGVESVYQPTLGSSCIKVLGMDAGVTGLTEQQAVQLGIPYKTSFVTDKNQTDYYPGQMPIHVKLIYHAETNVLLGGQVVGKKDAVQRVNVLATAIQCEMTTKQLGMLDLCYAPPFARTWDVLNVAGNVAK